MVPPSRVVIDVDMVLDKLSLARNDDDKTRTLQVFHRRLAFNKSMCCCQRDKEEIRYSTQQQQHRKMPMRHFSEARGLRARGGWFWRRAPAKIHPLLQS